MKSFVAILFLIAFSSLGINAQKPIVVTEDSLEMGKAVLPSLSVNIPEANYEKVMKAWKKELESMSKSKIVVDKDDITMYGAKLKSVSPDPVNVYSKLVPLDSAVQLTVAFEGKKDEYIDKKAGGLTFTKAKEYLKDFAKNQYLDIAKDQADNEDKKLRDLQKDLSSLEKDKSRLQKRIEADSVSLLREDDNVKIQRNELESLSAEVIDQKNTPQAEAGSKEKADYIKNLDKRKNKALDEIESSQNKMNKLRNEMDKARGEIPANERSQDELKIKIEAQQKIADKFADKVKTIESY
jgi:chromosome segregation ATPase